MSSPIIPHKVCSSCNKEKPATLEYFHTRTHSVDGLRHVCKECVRAQRTALKEQRKAATNGNPYNDSQKKICQKCKRALPKTQQYWHISWRHVDGLKPHCKDCRSQAAANLYTREKERIRKRNREWQEANRESQNKKSRERYRQKRDEILEWSRNYYWQTRDAQIKRSKQYYQTEEGKIRAKLRHQKRRAQKAKAEGSHTLQEVEELYEKQKGKCAYCHCDLNRIFHEDHIIPLSKGGSDYITNIALACPKCNTSKNARTPEEWKNRWYYQKRQQPELPLE